MYVKGFCNHVSREYSSDQRNHHELVSNVQVDHSRSISHHYHRLGRALTSYQIDPFTLVKTVLLIIRIHATVPAL